ncbi:hypothetical protein EX895_006159 [Sporisorium graminicola]|uniref:Uncharacterized protein n=1 Tax=Sporisorium graminicola TaxID=280036 RepID=A0A4V6ETG2_9BASI|nr:hypothetical protein EX895_006159 [Sporisorium graminicola]TKY85079.1 hypothetical protein EX895_006159 [Sporisorium graminicola]
MPTNAYHGSQAAGSSYPSYPPGAPSSSYYDQFQRRYSLERPPSQAGSSRSPHGLQPPHSPLYLPPQHPHGESDEYEERDLGEIAAANQAAQEQRWGPHAALSEAPARYELYRDQHTHVDRHTSMPVMPAYEPLHYDGGFYMQSQPPGSFEPVPQYPGAPSIASGYTMGGRSRQSLPVQASPLMHPPPTSSASEPPNMFNVNAAHHLPGAHARPHDAFQHATRIGDPLPGFPNWSQTWYGGHLSADGHAYTMVPPGSGQSGWESETLSHGLPAPYGPYPYGRTMTNDQVKEERIRMLEKEFGPRVTHKTKHDAENDDDIEAGETPVGSVDERGRLVLPRRKVRITTRWLQCLVSLAAAGLGIGGFILIRPEHKAPPSGTFASFVLYGVSALSTIVCLWLFALKPCCRSSRVPAGAAGMGGTGAGNGMVLPIMAAGGGGAGSKSGLFGKKNKVQPGPFVNLIVDPSLLGKRADDSDSETDADDSDDDEAARRRKKRRGKKKRKAGMLATMKLQARWRVARTSLKWDCGWDVVLCLLWGAAAVMSLGVGKKCPSGTAEGWCNLYNGAIACSVVATLLFLVAIYCDVVGLRSSSAPPKGS